MGAASLDQVNSASAVKSLDGYDYILIEDRMSARPNPGAWEETGKLCNFLWLKQCIVSGSHVRIMTCNTDTASAFWCRSRPRCA
jgi:hypothetical protein